MNGIEAHDLVKRWDKVLAVDRVSFRVAKGSLTVLLGPSGCGKSTILRMIAGLEKVTSGRVTIAGQDVTHTDAAKRGVSMVFQSYALFPHLNVRENILFGLKVRRISPAERRRRLGEVAKMVGLEELLQRKPANLSGGQRQRVALARSIVSQQPVCLMDEPLSNLDAKLRNEMRDEIRGLQQKLGLTMIYVTHDQTEAMTMADQVVLLKNGRVEQTGPPHALYERPATAFAARFIGSPPMNLLVLDLIEDRSALKTAGNDAPVPEGACGWRIGIRPEHIQLGQRGLPVRVATADFLGAETVVRLHHGEQALFARINGRVQLTPGDEIKASWSPDDVHLFDEKGIRQSGKGAARTDSA
jgi:sn-glycerol 3-phosphate transport system ATP-binding protein